MLNAMTDEEYMQLAEHAALQAEIEKLMLRWEELMTAAEALKE